LTGSKLKARIEVVRRLTFFINQSFIERAPVRAGCTQRIKIEFILESDFISTRVVIERNFGESGNRIVGLNSI
jgi:hypothetical protein